MEDDKTNPTEIDSVAISRRGAFRLAGRFGLGAAGLASGLGAAGQAGGIGTAFAEDASSGLPTKPYKFHFVCHVTLDQFFTPTVYGIQDACAAFGCSYQWTGSQKNVVSEMVSAMQTAIAQKSDGIAVCLVDPTAFDAATDMAAQAGIPVVAFNADVPVGSPNKRLSYVGQPLYQSGYNSALKWLKPIGPR